ncbi:chromosomal replication initiator protein DnaA [Thermospira aquatica]|uniref:Chromosomal replication initiator protein DnaA n=1 Tax=Thermospira aquatica TaxID=2828656 RepID=A0AAX3BBG6_9SPIR|nr:chromosomal replication initiator protein DnaA [Thermospira aquatica]URA09450.1 chromosomal replication initiator protein DnaA [Thermospira aquatica]
MDLWNEIARELSQTFDSELNRAILEKIRFKEVQNDKIIVLIAPDPLTSGWFEANYRQLAESIAFRLTQKPYVFQVEIAPHQVVYKKVSERSSVSEAGVTQPYLNPKYTFERFVVGSNNDFAHAAAMQVAQCPGTNYNPLFIYGNVAVGKTHLIQAIAHYILKNSPEKKVRYVTSEVFANEFIESISKKNTEHFRSRYRTLDVLIIDDVQFFQGKESTLEEFFHTFNTLLHEKKQVVFACDRPPHLLKNISDRLLTRFNSGLTIKIENPDMETRMAILTRRVEEESLDISTEVIRYIAEHIDSDIRNLEGALTKLIAYADLRKKEISLDLAKEVLRDKIQMEVPKNLTVTDIQRAVARYFNINVNDLKSERRLENITYARHIAMYLAKEHTNLSLTEIGSLFGGKAHTTVMRSADKIEKMMKTRKKVRKEIEDIIALFYEEKTSKKEKETTLS